MPLPLPGANQAPAAAESGHLRLLALIASPLSNAAGDGPPQGQQLDVWGEWERLRQSIAAAHDPVNRRAAPWEVIRQAPSTAAGLQTALIAAPDVLHVCAHAGPEGLLIEDDLGREAELPRARLAQIVRGRGLKLAVLNACATAKIAKALLDAGVPAVVGSSDKIFDGEGMVFARHFHGALATGASVGEALAAAQAAIIAAYESRELPWRVGASDASEQRAAIFQLWGDADLRLSRPAAPASAPLVHLHPRPIGGAPPFDLLTGFVGRREQLLALGRWFDATGKGVFAISGVGGVGKTTLALAAALRHLHRFAALAFASAKAQPDFGLRQVLEATAAALQVQPDERMYANPAAAIATLLNARPLLLLLDNLESLDADAIQDLARALRGADFRNGSRVLLTLRPHERSPLTDLAGGDRLALETLARQDACRLVREEADRLGLPDERLRHPDPATAGSLGMTRHDGQLAAGIDQIAALCFDHPGLLRLALRMLRRHDRAGLNLRLHTLQGKEVQAALTEFIGLMVADLEKQSPAAVQTLVAAAVFVGGAAEPLLAQVARGEPLAEAERIAWEDDWLLPAVDAGLLRQVSAGRYDLDAPVRGFLGKVRPLAAETERQLHLRHAQALLPVVAAWGDLIAAQEMTYAAPREWDNVTAAWDRLCEMGGADEAGETLLAFSEEWGNTVRNNYDPRRLHWLESAAQAAFRIGSEWQQANVLKAQGDVLAFQNQNDEALQHYEHAFRLFQQVGSSLGQANVLQAQGDVLAFQKQNDEALQHYEHAFRLFQQVGDRLGQANVLKAQGHVLAFQKQNDAALQHYEHAFRLFQQVGDRLGQANVLKAQGHVLAFQKQNDAALQHYEHAFRLFQQVGDRLGQANVLKAQGDVLAFLDRRDEALQHYEHAFRLFQQVGSSLGQANVAFARGEIARRQGDFTAARTYYAQALEPYRHIGARVGEANVLDSLGEVAEAQEDWQNATKFFAAALHIYEAIGASYAAVTRRNLERVTQKT